MQLLSSQQYTSYLVTCSGTHIIPDSKNKLLLRRAHAAYHILGNWIKATTITMVIAAAFQFSITKMSHMQHSNSHAITKIRHIQHSSSQLPKYAIMAFQFTILITKIFSFSFSLQKQHCSVYRCFSKHVQKLKLKCIQCCFHKLKLKLKCIYKTFPSAFLELMTAGKHILGHLRTSVYSVAYLVIKTKTKIICVTNIEITKTGILTKPKSTFTIQFSFSYNWVGVAIFSIYSISKRLNI